MTDTTKERPILFSGAMVRALLAGTKTQTRRIMRLQPGEGAEVRVERFHQTVVDRHGDEQPGPEVFGAWWDDGERGLRCPYGQPGDRLWVREAIRLVPDQEPDDGTGRVDSIYAADGTLTVADAWPWRRNYLPPMHCPRGLSRITLEITEVRVERLQDISADDAQAEGITFTDYGRQCGHTGSGWTEVGACNAPADTHPQRPGWGVEPTSHMQCMHSAPAAFSALWSQINGPGSVDANPWVWAVSFRRIS